MDGSQLSIVGSGYAESASSRLCRLRQELKVAAADEVLALGEAMDRLSQIAREVLLARDAFPAGVSETCRTLIDDLQARRKSIELIMSRSD